MGVYPVLIDSRPPYLGGSGRAPSLLLLPLGSEPARGAPPSAAGDGDRPATGGNRRRRGPERVPGGDRRGRARDAHRRHRSGARGSARRRRALGRLARGRSALLLPPRLRPARPGRQLPGRLGSALGELPRRLRPGRRGGNPGVRRVRRRRSSAAHPALLRLRDLALHLRGRGLVPARVVAAGYGARGHSARGASEPPGGARSSRPRPADRRHRLRPGRGGRAARLERALRAESRGPGRGAGAVPLRRRTRHPPFGPLRGAGDRAARRRDRGKRRRARARASGGGGADRTGGDRGPVPRGSGLRRAPAGEGAPLRAARRRRRAAFRLSSTPAPPDSGRRG